MKRLIYFMLAGICGLGAGCGTDDAPAMDSSGGGGGAKGDAPGGGAGQGGGGVSGGPSRTLTVLSFNLRHGFPEDAPFFADIDDRTKMVADFITAQKPDVVLLQEASQNINVSNRAEALGDMTGYHWLWKKAENPGALDFLEEEGPAILTNHPIAWHGSTALPHTGDLDTDARAILGAGISLPDGTTLNVYSTHLGGSNKSENADQAKAAFDFTQKRISELPGFLAADMNAEPDWPSQQFFRGDIDWKGERGNFVDAWTKANPNDPGFTEPSDKPVHRIDFMYMIPGTKFQATVQHCEIVLKSDDGLTPSDHRGVMCTFGL